MKREIYKSKESLIGHQKAPNKSASAVSVIASAATFAKTMTDIGEALVNINDTVNSQKAAGDAIKMSMFENKSQDIQLNYNAYENAFITGGDYRAEAKKYALSIDPTGNLGAKISGIMNPKNLSNFMKNSHDKILTNNNLRAKDPALHAMVASGITGGYSPERTQLLIDFQVQNNIKPEDASVLSKSEADSIIRTVKGNDSAKATAALLSYFEDGPYKNNIVTDLTRHGLGTEYAVFANLPPDLQKSFLLGQALTDEDYTNWGKANPGLNVDATKNNLATALVDSKTLKNFMSAYTGNRPDKSAVLSPGMQKAILNTAMYHVFSGNYDQGDAVEFIEKAFEEAYHFSDDSDVYTQIVIPKSDGLDSDRIFKNLGSFFISEKNVTDFMNDPEHDVVPFTSVQLENLGIFDDKGENYKLINMRVIQDAGTWVNSDDGKGAMLMIRLDQVGTSVPVLNSKGTPVIWSFKDIASKNIEPVLPRFGHTNPTMLNYGYDGTYLEPDPEYVNKDLDAPSEIINFDKGD